MKFSGPGETDTGFLAAPQRVASRLAGVAAEKIKSPAPALAYQSATGTNTSKIGESEPLGAK